MTGNADVIRDYFGGWQKDLERVKSLLGNPKYYLEAILVLSCYIGAFGSLRYPGKQDNKAYKTVVREYSGKQDFYDQVDLLFFLQWPRSDYSNDREYLKLKGHASIANIIKTTYGDEEQIRTGTRYVSQQDFVNSVNQAPFQGFDRENLQRHLPLFSLCEMLYRYVRCHGVHRGRFPLVRSVTTISDSVRYEDNHAITGSILLETTENILGNLSKQCLEQSKWPWEL
ncbi:MAG: hypothetical protein EWM72_00147 [Nitrospira sp.]|nr:MAG: hypothetical protein EWM72_00147 [Nitrospira sp.]